MSTPMTDERRAEIRDEIAGPLDGSMGCLIRADQHRRELLAELDRLHSWAGLLSLLDEHWPACAWPAMSSVGDAQDPSRTDSARIIGLIRWVEELLTLAARLNDQAEDLTHRLGQRQEDCERVRAALLPLLVGQSLAGDRTTMRAGHVAEVAAMAISDLTAEWERARQMVDWERERRNKAEQERDEYRQRWHLSATGWHRTCLKVVALADRLDAGHAGGQLLDTSEQDLVERLVSIPQTLRDLVCAPRNLGFELETQVSPAPHSRDLHQELTDWRQQLLDHPGTCATGDIAHCIAMLLAGDTVMPSTVEALRRERTRHHLLRQRVLDELPDVDATRHDLELVDLVSRVRSVVEDQPGPRTLRVHWGAYPIRAAEQQVRALAHALAASHKYPDVRATGGTDGSIRVGEAVITWSSLGCLADVAAAVLREQAGTEAAATSPQADAASARRDDDLAGWTRPGRLMDELDLAEEPCRRCAPCGCECRPEGQPEILRLRAEVDRLTAERAQAGSDTAPAAVDGPAAQLDGEVTGDGG